MCVEGFLWMGSQGVLSTADSLLLRDCQNASEGALLPHGVHSRSVRAITLRDLGFVLAIKI